MTEATQDFEKMGVEFQNSLLKFIQKSDDLRKNQIHRVLKALAAHPLEEELITLNHEDEIEVYEIGKEIQSLKLNMMVESLRQDAAEERNKNKIPDNIEVPDYAKEK